MQTVWLLDVDGVLNALKPTSTGWDDRVEYFTENGFRINYSPALIKEINDLHDSGRVEVQWLTTWFDHINLLPFSGKENWKVANTLHEYKRIQNSWWKLPVVQRIAKEYDRVIWTDDDISFDSSAINWIRTKSKKGEMLGISPNRSNGLTPKHIKLIKNFLDKP